MPEKKFHVPDIGEVAITRKRGQKTIRLRVNSEGSVLISTPWLVPKAFALNFLESKKSWVIQQQNNLSVNFYNGMQLGKDSQLIIHHHSQSNRTRIKDGNLYVHLANASLAPADNEYIRKAVYRLLKMQADKHLLPRIEILSQKTSLHYNAARVKHLTGRWGSCDDQKNISISLFLVQLPWDMIDYVLIHELAHTAQMNHSRQFWNIVAQNCPDYKVLRKKMRLIQPRVYDPKTFM